MSEHREISLHLCSPDFDEFPTRGSVLDPVGDLTVKLQRHPIRTG